MRLLLNVIWLVFGGFWLFLGYVLAGVLLCIPISLAPLGKDVVPTRRGDFDRAG